MRVDQRSLQLYPILTRHLHRGSSLDIIKLELNTPFLVGKNSVNAMEDEQVKLEWEPLHHVRLDELQEEIQEGADEGPGVGDLLHPTLPVPHGRPVQFGLEDEVGVVHDGRGVLVLGQAGEDDEAEGEVVVGNVRLGVLHGDGDVLEECDQQVNGLDVLLSLIIVTDHWCLCVRGI